MAIPAFVGRGSLLVSVLGASRGFFTLSGESELTLALDEDNESVQDARNGVIERVDWYARNYRARLEAECYRIDENALQLLLKAYHSTVAGGAGVAIALPNPVTVGEGYLLKPNISAYAVTDATPGVVSADDYEIDQEYGIITFSDTAGYTQPFTVTVTHTGHEAFALEGGNQIHVEALFKGFNKYTGQKCLAHFYRLVVDLSDTFTLIQKGFSPLKVRLQATPDLSQTPDQAIGHYGRIMLL